MRIGAFLLVWTLFLAAAYGRGNPIDALTFGPIVIVVLVALTRFGLLVTLVPMLVFNLRYPITTHLTAWYGQSTTLVILTIVGITLYGFHTSLGGRPIFGEGLLEDS